MRVLELIQEQSGKLSSTRFAFLVWSLGLFVRSCFGIPPTLEEFGFVLTLAGLKGWQTRQETKPTAGATPIGK